MFYSPERIALKSIDEFYTVTDKLMNNTFVDYDINGIQVNVEVEKEPRIAKIIDAVANPIIVSPGDPIHVTVHLHTYRGENIERELVYTVPKDMPLGDMTLEVRGGGVTPLPYLIQQQKLNLTDEVVSRLHTYKDFASYFKKLKYMDTNNQIVVEALEKDVSMVDSNDKRTTAEAKLMNMGARPDVEAGLTKGRMLSDDSFDGDTTRAILNTEYVIKGDGQFAITVLSEKDRDKALANLVKSRMEEAKQKAKEAETKKLSLRERIEAAKKVTEIERIENDSESKEDTNKA